MGRKQLKPLSASLPVFSLFYFWGSENIAQPAAFMFLFESVLFSSLEGMAMSLRLSLSKPAFLPLPRFGVEDTHQLHGRGRISRRMKMHSQSFDSQTIREKVERQDSLDVRQLSIPSSGKLKPPDLQFNRLQPSDEEFNQRKREFGDFMAREAVLEEEYWTAAWLRAESHWENRANERYADSYKRQYAEQEFHAIRRRCKKYHGQKCTCIVTVKKEDKNVKRTVIKSIVGTLDLSIRYLLQGESFPQERVKVPPFCSTEKTDAHKYGYVANLCVSKSARHNGIASNMMLFALESAKLKGVEQVFVHVHRENKPAQQLYQKLGFEVICYSPSAKLFQFLWGGDVQPFTPEAHTDLHIFNQIIDNASPQLLEEQTYLLLCKI